MPTDEQKAFLRRHAGQNAINNLMLDWMEEIVATVEDLRQAVADMQTAGAAAAQEITQLSNQIESLHQAGASNISQSDLDALVNQAHAAATTLTSATTAAQGAPVGPVSAATPPSAASQSSAPGQAGPGQTAAGQVAGTDTQTTPATGATQTAPPAAATDPAQAGSPATPAPGAATAPTGASAPTADDAGRTMYVHDNTINEDQVNAAEWPDAPYRTTAGQPLHYFSGDTNPGDQKGADVSGWSVYTGGIVATG